MPRLFSHLLLAIAFLLPAENAGAFGAPATDCRQTSMDHLKALAPAGFAIYTRMNDKPLFFRWLKCEDLQLGLSTAVHESVHTLTQERDAFPLINHGELRRPHEVSGFFPPSVIATKFDRDDPFVSTYLGPHRASSASDFLYLLDEMNAYSHDLNVAIALNGLRPADQYVDHRDGLAALMAFVAIYLETAERNNPITWSGLRKPEIAKAVSGLWRQAETVMTLSCGINNFGSRDQNYIRQFCADKPRSALRQILGRPPVCPAECLQTSPKSAFRQ
jgi:hypothetical protein